jgi:hypothetical protein
VNCICFCQWWCQWSHWDCWRWIHWSYWIKECEILYGPKIFTFAVWTSIHAYLYASVSIPSKSSTHWSLYLFWFICIYRTCCCKKIWLY